MWNVSIYICICVTRPYHGFAVYRASYICILSIQLFSFVLNQQLLLGYGSISSILAERCIACWIMACFIIEDYSPDGCLGILSTIGSLWFLISVLLYNSQVCSLWGEKCRLLVYTMPRINDGIATIRGWSRNYFTW